MWLYSRPRFEELWWAGKYTISKYITDDYCFVSRTNGRKCLSVCVCVFVHESMHVCSSPQEEFLGFWSSSGPLRPMIRAPMGAVRRIESTATVSTSMPYFCSCWSSLVRAMSRAVEPIAAWEDGETVAGVTVYSNS